MTTASDPGLPLAQEAAAVTPPAREAEAAASPAAAMTLPRLKPLVAAVVLLLALSSLLDVAVANIGRTMPALHIVATPIAVGVMVLLWGAELGGLRWPRLLFVALVTAPNVWLAYIGHISLNFLFLMLTVAWVGYRGSRTEGLATLALNLAVPVVPLLADIAYGGTWYYTWYQAGVIWIPWAVLVVFAWGMSRALVRQQRLAAELSALLAERSALLEVSHNVASTLELQPLLGLILDQLKAVVPYTGAGITVQDGDEVRIIGYRGPGPEGMAVGTRLPLARVGPLWQVMRQPTPVTIPDVRADTPLARVYRDTVGDALETSFSYVRSWMAVPLRVKEREVGSLFLEHSVPGRYTAHQAALALAMAQHAAIAIENARLYERAQEVATLEERQRLARELHDSVSQALYGIALGGRTARTLLDRDPAQVAQPLDYVLALAETGLAEMRALIFELLPDALENEGLVAALDKQLAAVRARHGLAITATLGAEPDLPLAVKEALYRIAQEALHNTVKHAQARTVEVRLGAGAEALLLEVRDDGAGFETAGTYPGHLGQHTMRERAESLGGTLEVVSAPGAGTCVRAQIPIPARSRAQDLAPVLLHP